MSLTRWQAVSQSQFAWEREALDWLRHQLPDREPWHAWTHFEFIDEEGKVNEVDALILTPAGLFLVEIKSRPGTVSGDAHTWSWVTDGRERAYDNPLICRQRPRLAPARRDQAHRGLRQTTDPADRPVGDGGQPGRVAGLVRGVG